MRWKLKTEKKVPNLWVKPRNAGQSEQNGELRNQI